MKLLNHLYAQNRTWAESNWAYQTANGTRLEFKNILNQIVIDKTANTYGWNNYRQGNFKYFNNQIFKPYHLFGTVERLVTW